MLIRTSLGLGVACLMAGLGGCVIERPGPVVYAPAPAPAPQPVYEPAYEEPPAPVVSVYVDPPLYQPPPIACPWAPPPMLVEVPPPPPPGAVWIGGYWVWQGTWVWAHGHWAYPPQPSYHWVQPYYENRDSAVVFIAGHWAPGGVAFAPPPPGIFIQAAIVLGGAVRGPRPIGPPGVFVPPPPGSRPGIIVPAPIGTPPAVMSSAPPVVNVGMRVQANSTVNNTTVINNITNVTVIAPANATANGQPVRAVVPAQAHLAASLPPVVRGAVAPEPVSRQAIPTWAPGRPLPALPPAQPSRRVEPPVNQGGPAPRPLPGQVAPPAPMPAPAPAPAGRLPGWPAPPIQPIPPAAQPQIAPPRTMPQQVEPPQVVQPGIRPPLQPQTMPPQPGALPPGRGREAVQPPQQPARPERVDPRGVRVQPAPANQPQASAPGRPASAGGKGEGEHRGEGGKEPRRGEHEKKPGERD